MQIQRSVQLMFDYNNNMISGFMHSATANWLNISGMGRMAHPNIVKFHHISHNICIMISTYFQTFALKYQGKIKISNTEKKIFKKKLDKHLIFFLFSFDVRSFIMTVHIKTSACDLLYKYIQNFLSLMHSFAKLQSPPLSVVFLCVCHKVYQKHENMYAFLYLI